MILLSREVPDVFDLWAENVPRGGGITERASAHHSSRVTRDRVSVARAAGCLRAARRREAYQGGKLVLLACMSKPSDAYAPAVEALGPPRTRAVSDSKM